MGVIKKGRLQNPTPVQPRGSARFKKRRREFRVSRSRSRRRTPSACVLSRPVCTTFSSNLFSFFLTSLHVFPHSRGIPLGGAQFTRCPPCSRGKDVDGGLLQTLRNVSAFFPLFLLIPRQWAAPCSFSFRFVLFVFYGAYFVFACRFRLITEFAMQIWRLMS